MRYTRRFVLLWIGCASGLSLMPRHVQARAHRATPDELAARLRTLLYDRAAARRLGRLYVRQVPAEDDPRILARLTVALPEAQQVDAIALDRTSLRHRLDARVRGDFASGTTVQLDGWVLSRTEARLCALCR
ncbi:MAG TPA: hypothetical protein VN757_07095 [Steroidobacteraceae bacterium]|nr:hypothetical protein [Steroidobacteraceae bacterium]